MTSETNEKILAALKEKLPNGMLGDCSICQTKKWELVPDSFLAFPLRDEPLYAQYTSAVLPCVALVCTNCGNTHFLNMKKLGLQSLLKAV